VRGKRTKESADARGDEVANGEAGSESRLHFHLSFLTAILIHRTSVRWEPLKGKEGHGKVEFTVACHQAFENQEPPLETLRDVSAKLEE
jgi:hypothetical protein